MGGMVYKDIPYTRLYADCNLICYRLHERVPDDGKGARFVARTTRPVPVAECFEKAKARSMCFKLPMEAWERYREAAIVLDRVPCVNGSTWTVYKFPDESTAFIRLKRKSEV